MPGPPFGPDRAQDAPRTRASIARDLRALGLRSGETVLLHSSLSSLGWVCGGAEAVGQAILDVLGPDGTLVVPTQTGHNSDPSNWWRPRIPNAWRQAIFENMPAFDPHTTPSTEMGRIAEYVRTLPGAVRSPHPQRSFAAVGPRAHELMAHHPLECRFGEQSPLGRMLGACVLLLGVGYDVCTALHLAEYRIPGAPTERCSCAVNLPDGRSWVTYTDTAVYSDDFASLGEALEATGVVTIGHVGSATARLIPVAAAVDFAVTWLTEHRRDTNQV